MGKITKAADALKGVLEMAYEARMARAKEMGFDTEKTWYHGTNQNFDAFDPARVNTVEPSGDYLGEGFYFTQDPSKAGRYAEQAGKRNSGEPAIIPAHLRMSNPLVIENAGDFDEALKNIEVPNEIRELGGLSDQEMRMVAFYDMEPRQQAEFIRAQGYDGLLDQRYGQAAVVDPEQIRSVNAAFDPAKKDSANLLAGVGGLGILGAAMAPTEDAAAAELVNRTSPDGILSLRDGYLPTEKPEQSYAKSVGNTLLELAAAANRGVTSGIDFFTVDQANALLQLLGNDYQYPTLTETLAPATTGNTMNPGLNREAVRFIGELGSPI